MVAVATKLGRYEILRKLGAGGMGEVYLAQDTKLDRKVALKILPADAAANHERIRRFVQEAKAASALNHPNIVTIHEIEAADSIHYIATEFIDGETLRQRIKRAPMELAEVLDVAQQTAAALAAAHLIGIVHRDIKPENIMLRRDGIVKVLDFGLAKLSERAAAGAFGGVHTEALTQVLRNTTPGTVMGTAAYMSPEQARGKAVDARSDIWSLGVVLYEMVARRLPFEGETTTDVLALILHKEPPPLAHLGTYIPSELDRIVAKALKKDKEQRYQVVKDLGLDLESLNRRLEFEAELERTGSQHRISKEASPACDNSTATGAATIAAVPAGPTSGAGDFHTASSAEYIAHEIKQHKRSAAILVTTLLLAIASSAYFYFARGAKAPINSVAIMPFVNVTNDPNAEYLSDGISESLINNLSQLPQLKVIARTSTFRYKGKEFDPEEVAKALGVHAIVTGRVTQRGDDLQISAELMNSLDKTQMWGAQYSRRAADLQAVQVEIAQAISEKLRLRLTGVQEQQLAKRATANPQAYQLYLTAMYYQRRANVEDFKKALDYRKQAVALDPSFALAWAGIAVSYVNLSVSGLDAREAMAKAKEAAQTAVALDETLPEAHSSLALVKRFEWDWTGAESEHKRTIELNPNYAANHNNYTGYLVTMGRTEEALAENKRAQELDPFRIVPKANQASIFMYARRYDEAIQASQDVIKLQPDYGLIHEYLANTYAAKRMYTEAIDEYQKFISINGETTGILSYLGYALAMAGQREKALAILNKLKTSDKYVSPADLCVLYAGLGDKEAAFESLERAYAEHDMQLWSLKVNPHYDSLRADPRFADLMRRVGFVV